MTTHYDLNDFRNKYWELREQAISSVNQLHESSDWDSEMEILEEKLEDRYHFYNMRIEAIDLMTQRHLDSWAVSVASNTI